MIHACIKSQCLTILKQRWSFTSFTQEGISVPCRPLVKVFINSSWTISASQHPLSIRVTKISATPPEPAKISQGIEFWIFLYIFCKKGLKVDITFMLQTRLLKSYLKYKMLSVTCNILGSPWTRRHKTGISILPVPVRIMNSLENICTRIYRDYWKNMHLNSPPYPVRCREMCLSILTLISPVAPGLCGSSSTRMKWEWLQSKEYTEPWGRSSDGYVAGWSG